MCKVIVSLGDSPTFYCEGETLAEAYSRARCYMTGLPGDCEYSIQIVDSEEEHGG